jgi:hypothetical protein
MKKSHLSIALYLLLVFASGVLVGGFGHRLYSVNSNEARNERPRPEVFRKRYVERMERRLKLSADQIVKLNAILDVTGARLNELRERSKPETHQIHQEQVQSIQAILTEEQQREYAKMREEREKERKQRGNPPS